MPRKRETIEPNPGDKRYARRDSQGLFIGDQVDAGRSLSKDRKQAAKQTISPVLLFPSSLSPHFGPCYAGSVPRRCRFAPQEAYSQTARR
jgi:hypothetical protein